MIPRFAREKGAAAERAAERWLNRQGLALVTRNFRCKTGEIDLIMRDGEYLVFIEVRLRSRSDYGDAAASVTQAKQQRLIRAAQQFLLSESRWRHQPCRFDVLAGQPLANAAGFEWLWLRAAFSAE